MPCDRVAIQNFYSSVFQLASVSWIAGVSTLTIARGQKLQRLLPVLSSKREACVGVRGWLLLLLSNVVILACCCQCISLPKIQIFLFSCKILLLTFMGPFPWDTHTLTSIHWLLMKIFLLPEEDSKVEAKMTIY